LYIRQQKTDKPSHIKGKYLRYILHFRTKFKSCLPSEIHHRGKSSWSRLVTLHTELWAVVNFHTLDLSGVTTKILRKHRLRWTDVSVWEQKIASDIDGGEIAKSWQTNTF